MIEKTIYIAVDGQEFDDEEDCLEHEFSLKDCSGIILADSNKKRIPFKYDTDLERVAYIIVKTKESADILQDSCDRQSVVSPWNCYKDGNEPSAGAYFWDDNSYSWISYEDWKSDMLEQIQKKEEIFSKISKGD